MIELNTQCGASGGVEAWTPETVFLITYCASALSGVAGLLWSSRPLNARNLLGCVLFFGAAGTALGMMCFEYFGGKEKPVRVILCGILVGIGAIRPSDIKHAARKVVLAFVDDKKIEK